MKAARNARRIVPASGAYFLYLNFRLMDKTKIRENWKLRDIQLSEEIENKINQLPAPENYHNSYNWLVVDNFLEELYRRWCYCSKVALYQDIPARYAESAKLWEHKYKDLCWMIEEKYKGLVPAYFIEDQNTDEDE